MKFLIQLIRRLLRGRKNKKDHRKAEKSAARYTKTLKTRQKTRCPPKKIRKKRSKKIDDSSL